MHNYQPEEDLVNKNDLLNILKLCNADTTAIDAVELAYNIGFKAGLVYTVPVIEKMGMDGYGTLAIAEAVRNVSKHYD